MSLAAGDLQEDCNILIMFGGWPNWPMHFSLPHSNIVRVMIVSMAIGESLGSSTYSGNKFHWAINK